MKYLTRLILLFITLLITTYGYGQFYDIGQSRSDQQWSKIETENFKIIFPSSYGEQARKAAAIFEMAHHPVSSGLQTSVRKTPVIFHLESPVSNAYSIWAPRRIEILTTPPQDLYAQPWMQQLALHEYRHIVQLSKLNQGITRTFGYFFGEQAVVVSTGIFVPSWFLEGDAVASETAFSESGRGRIAAFSMPLRAQLLEKGAYSYPKASLGSYRDFVPNIYITGYHIVAAARNKYGINIWNEALNSVARQPWTITPFNYGLKKVSGLNKKGIYRESLVMLDSLWKKKPAVKTSHIFLSSEPGCYTNYNYPNRINDSVIVALKTSFNDIPQIVRIDGKGNERIIFTPGYMPDDRISYGGGWLAWAEYRPHIRWETVGFTTIVLFNPATGEVRKIKSSGRRYSPVKGPGDSGIAVIEIESSGENFLTIIRQDETTTRLQIPDGMTASAPQWSPDGQRIVIVVNGNKGKALAIADLATSRISYLTTFSYSEISNPAFGPDNLYFTGTMDGLNQICRYNLTTGQSEVITEAGYGATQSSLSDGQLLYADYTSGGYRIATIDLMASLLQLKPYSDLSYWPLAEVLSAQENGFIFPDSIPDTEYGIEPYRKGSNLFGIHSWAPLYVDIGGQTVRPGVSVMSQNLLSTLMISAGYDYNMTEETCMFRSDIAWEAWYPVLQASVSTGMRAAAITEENGSARRFTWNETTLDLSISQSLNLSRGAYTSGLYGELSHNYTSIANNSSTPENFTDGVLSGLTYKVFAYHYRNQAYRDLAPRIGFNLDIKYRHTPFGQLKAGNIAAVQTQIFLPGIAPNHSMLLYAGIQESNPEKYKFSDILSISRGYSILLNADRLISAKAGYRLPLFYPDFHLGGLVYIKRIRAGAFFDFTRSKEQNSINDYNSAGLDLVSDMHLLGLSTPVSFGLRSVYLLRSGDFTFGLLFSMNLYQY